MAQSSKLQALAMVSLFAKVNLQFEVVPDFRGHLEKKLYQLTFIYYML